MIIICGLALLIGPILGFALLGAEELSYKVIGAIWIILGCLLWATLG